MDNMNIRRALAESGMELPADRPVPAMLVDDLHTPPGLDDGGAGIVEQTERFDEFTGGQYIIDAPIDDNQRVELLKALKNCAGKIVYVSNAAENVTTHVRPTTDPASRAIAAHTTPGKTGENPPTIPTPDEMREIMDAVSQGPAYIALAVAWYGLRLYKAGAEFAIRSMTNG